ncbi:MAG TPA: DUF4912 domain-containing protein [Clostridia bacterium]|nr:DUF4912 domain-containing protein [Clostridia bacterium]
MTPLLFIVIVTATLTLLIYWVLTTLKEPGAPSLPAQRFRYEFAPELTAEELYLARDSIKLVGDHARDVYVYWNLSRATWETKTAELGIKPNPECLCLRLYEAKDWLQYYDIKLSSIAGKLKLELQPEAAYYVSLGCKHKNRFVPLLTSNTVKKPE